MPYTEFCCRSGGSNLNAGSRNGTTEPNVAADFTYTNGSWVAATGVFTPASGNPLTDGVAVGDFVSVYPNAASITTFVGRVTARDATTITVSLTVKAGVAPVDGALNTTLRVGGAWKGPNAASSFPFNLVTWGNLLNIAGNPLRVNLKNDAAYNVTTSVILAAPVTTGPKPTVQGYTTTYGDLGKANIDGGVVGASFILLSQTVMSIIVDIILSNNGATGVSALATGGFWLRCVFRDSMGAGINGANTTICIECEATACNKGASINAGFASNGSRSHMVLIRCISHHNSTAGSYGFLSSPASGSGGLYAIDCIAHSNASHGFYNSTVGSGLNLKGCIAYANGGAGVTIANIGTLMNYIENCIFVNNVGYGVDYLDTISTPGVIYLLNNAFFGNLAATNGISNNIAAITLTSDPFVDAVNGNFRFTQAAATQLLGTGRGSFTQTVGYTSSTATTPNVGLNQSALTLGSAGGTNNYMPYSEI